MAKSKKRRTKKTPNLPLEALERARQQINEDEMVTATPDEEVAEADENEAVESAAVGPAISDAERTALRRERRKNRKNQDLESFQYSRNKKKTDGLDSAEIERLLAHPTKLVTEEELRREYRHVISDLRSMGILAAALLVFLIVLAQTI